MASNSLIGALTVTLGADTAAFSAGLKDSQNKLGEFGKIAGSLGRAAFFGIAAAAATGGAAMVKFGIDSLGVADDIGDAASRLGVASSEFQKLQVAAVSAGGSTEVIGSAMDKLNQNLGKAKDGSKIMSEAFAQAGISADALKNMTADKAFYAIADGMQKIQDPATKARLSMELFGKSAGVDMLEVLQKSGTELRVFGETASATGRIMSDEMVQKLSEAKLKLDNVKTATAQMATVLAGQGVLALVEFLESSKPMFEQLKLIGTQIIEFLMPSVKSLIASFSDLAKNEGLINSLKLVGGIIGGSIVVAFKVFLEVVNLAIKAVDGFFRAITPISRILLDAATAFGSFGKNIVEGLINGFGAAEAIAIKAVQKLGSGVIAAFKAILGIHSPSKEFEILGNHINEGLALGIINSQELPLDAMVGVAKKLKETIPAMSSVGWIDGAQQELNDITASNDNMRTAFSETFSDGILQALKGGKIGDVFSTKLKEWAEKGLTASLDNLFGQIFDILQGSSSSGGFGGGIGGFISNIFGGFRAGGGGVSVGRAYVVGENSPELFVPKTAGAIWNPDQLNSLSGGGSASHINIHLGNELLDSRVIDISKSQAIQVTGAGMVGQRQAQYKRAAFGLR